jgi:hypothetical protein
MGFTQKFNTETEREIIMSKSPRVFLVWKQLYNYHFQEEDEQLLCICASREHAIEMRNKYVSEDIESRSKGKWTCVTHTDHKDNPVVKSFYNDVISDENTYVIQEWLLHGAKERETKK